MTNVKGIVTRVQHHLAPHSRFNVAITAVHITVTELDANGDPSDPAVNHDMSGIAWDFPALGNTVDGDEVDVTYDRDRHITAYTITKHY